MGQFSIAARTRVLTLDARLRPVQSSSAYDEASAASTDASTVAFHAFPYELEAMPAWGPSSTEQIYVRRVRGASGVTFCAGDGSGASCRCGTPGIAGRGCANAFTSRGAELSTRGNASLSDDSLTFIAYDATFGVSLLLQSSGSAATGGVPVEGGVLCVGSPALRIAVDVPSYEDLGVVKLFGRGACFGPRMQDLGGITSPGTRYYQVWTRAVGERVAPRVGVR